MEPSFRDRMINNWFAVTQQACGPQDQHLILGFLLFYPENLISSYNDISRQWIVFCRLRKLSVEQVNILGDFMEGTSFALHTLHSPSGESEVILEASFPFTPEQMARISVICFGY